MEKEFIPYEQALELKELGFDEECFARYVKGQLKIYQVFQQHPFSETALAPLYQQAFRFFRDKYGVKVISIGGDNERLYSYIIHLENNEQIFGKKEDTYDEAELACLKKLIEIVK